MAILDFWSLWTRTCFGFPIVCSNIPDAPAYVVSLSWSDIPELPIRSRGLLLTGKLLNHWLGWRQLFECFTVATVAWLTVVEYLCHGWLRVCSTCRLHFLILPHSSLIAGFMVGVIWRVPLVEWGMLYLPELLYSPRLLVGLVLFDI